MSDGYSSSALARTTREALLKSLENLEKIATLAPPAEPGLEHVANAVSALYSAETESETETAAGASLREAVEELSLALELLRELPREVVDLRIPELEPTLAAVAHALASLYPMLRFSQRRRREVLPPDVLPSNDRRALVELGNLLAPPVPSERARITLKMAAVDQRRSVERQLIEVDVGLLSDSNFYTGLSEDVSLGGVFVATQQPLPVGTGVTLFFRLQGRGVEAPGEVRWIREPSEGVTPGMGVAFGQLSPQDRAAIADYCSARPPMFHDRS